MIGQDAQESQERDPYDAAIALPEGAHDGPGSRGGGGFSVFHNSPCVWPHDMCGQPGAPVRVLLVDRDPHLRGVVTQELMRDERTVVSGQAASLRDGRRLVREVAFDVLLVELHLGDGPGYDLITYAKERRPACEVVVVSVLSTDDEATRAFQLGAAGFLVKNSWFGSYVQAVLQVANGGASVPPSLSRRLLVKPLRTPASPAGGSARHVVRPGLSEREREVLRMIAAGLTSNAIAGRLSISVATVNSHVKNTYLKLGVKTRAAAVHCALAWSLL